MLLKKSLLSVALMAAFASSALAETYTSDSHVTLLSNLETFNSADDTAEKDLIVKYTGTATYYGGAIASSGALSLNVKNFTAESSEKGIAVKEPTDIVSITAAENVYIKSRQAAVHITADSGKVPTGSVSITAGGDITLESTGGWAVHNNSDGEFNMTAGGKIYVISANGISNNSAKDLTVEAESISIETTSVGGVSANNGGTVTLKANDVSIENAGNYALKANNGTIEVEAQNTTISGNVTGNSGTAVNLNGETTITNGTVNTQGSVGIDGNMTFGEGATGTHTINEITGDNAKVTFSNTETNLNATTVSSTMKVGATGALNDELGGNAEALLEQLSTESKDNLAVEMAEGDVVGSVNGTKADGFVEQANTKNIEIADVATLMPAMITRTELNDVRKRMGDLRSSEAASGAWARYEGGKMSGLGLENEFNKVQVGIDTLAPNGVRLGMAFSYTDGEVDGAKTTSESDTYSLAAYGTWFGDKGQFVDVIARMATIGTDLTTSSGLKTEMDQFAMSLSGQYGWRFDVTDSFYVEPSVEATYTYLNSDKFEGGDVSFELDDTHSLIAKLGASAGFKCPSNKGDVYLRAGVVREFLGDTTLTTSNGISRAIDTDGADTWFEYGIGGNFNLTKSTYLWADVERTTGADIDEDWRGTVGVRYMW